MVPDRVRPGSEATDDRMERTLTTEGTVGVVKVVWVEGEQ